MIRPNIESAPNVKVMLNIGALFDIPTGFYVRGANEQNYLVGGLGALTAIVGIGNNFKSTILNFMMLSAANRMMSTTETYINTYDTEINIHEERLRSFINKFEYLKDKDIISSGLWTITDKTVYYGDQWFEKLKDYIDEKKKNIKDLESTTPFFDRDNKTKLKIITPTFSIVDSFTEFQTSDVIKMQDENELGESGGNTIHMRQGLAKTRFMMEAPILASSGYNYMLLTAHLGKDSAIATGPHQAPPTKKLQYLKNGDKLKGVTEKFTFLLNNCWNAYNAAPFINQGTKAAEYPREGENDLAGDLDLNIVTVRQLRGKSGPTGITLDILVSQSEGVLPTLTEFNYIKNSDRFGIDGSVQNYSLDLYPDVKLSRTSIRTKIDNDPKLRRAINITSELCQINQYHRAYDHLMCTPKQLREDLIKLGYDIDKILETRGWWTVNDDKNPIKFLSTLDLLELRSGRLILDWLKK